MNDSRKYIGTTYLGRLRARYPQKNLANAFCLLSSSSRRRFRDHVESELIFIFPIKSPMQSPPDALIDRDGRQKHF